MQTISINPALLKSLLTLAVVIEARDACTGGHTWRVSQYARLLGQSVGLSADEVFIVALSGLAHDIGKVGVPDAILNKKSKLTDEEYTVMKKHPRIGQTLTADHPLRDIMLEVVLQHHERFDGQGYPAGLSGSEISALARIVSIADAFDAMTSARPYRPGMSPEQAYQILIEESSRQFAPELAQAFVALGQQGALAHVLGHCADDRLLLTCAACGPIIVPPIHTRNGDGIVCPGCLGLYTLHVAADTFEPEWLGTFDRTYVPQPDEAMVDQFVQQMPGQVRVRL